MSIGLGVRCKDGIVLGCDSASTLVLGPEMTRPDQGKYFKVTDRIQLIGTGGYTDGVRLVREIQGRLPNHPDVMSTKDFEVILEDSALALHTRYNLDQDPPIRDGNDPRCDRIICGSGEWRCGVRLGVASSRVTGSCDRISVATVV